DPATVLGVSPVRVENIEDGHCETFWHRECTVEDAILFRDVARSSTGAGTLYEATGQQPARSARYREFLAPQGYGDELRAAFRTGDNTWGVVDLCREHSRAAFTQREVDLVRAISPAMAAALRTFATATSTSSEDLDAPGTALYDD